MRMIGLVIVILGALALGYGGFTYVTREKIVDAGPVQITKDKENAVWIPPVVGGVAVAAGLVLMVVGGGRTDA